MTEYQEFLDKKAQMGSDHGFEPTFLPDCLFGFQRFLTEWAVRKGRGAVLADCGLGKTLIELVFGMNVIRETNERVLLLTPLAVSDQMVREGEKFGIEVVRSRNGRLPKQAKIVVTNYEQLGKFRPEDFGGLIGDESSRVKHFDSRTKKDLLEFARKIPYRLLATATAAPNDYFELGNSSEVLGYLGFQDMMSRFFKEDNMKEFLAWGRKTYRFRGHAEIPFWRWVCSWARSCRSPSDLGFDDDGFVLPPLTEVEHVIPYSRAPKSGEFFSMPAKTRQEQIQERRETMERRCEKAAEVAIGHDGATVLWCHLNPEADSLERMIPGSLQVSGSMSDEKKEEKLLAFQRGQLKILITKPQIGCFGLNWQHCHNVVTFPSHSWEQYYQSVRRCWRFGQKEEVKVHVVTSEGEKRVVANLQRKAKQAESMFKQLVGHMNDAMSIQRDNGFSKKVKVPNWMGDRK